MKVSTKGRYALRLMAELTRVEPGACLSIKAISERQGISEKYLEQIVRPLTHAGLVVGTRGPQGGYSLARDASSITVGEVLRLTEGDLAPVDCVSDLSDVGCEKADSCETMFVWRKLKEAMEEVVDSITIADVAKHRVEACPASSGAIERIHALS